MLIRLATEAAMPQHDVPAVRPGGGTQPDRSSAAWPPTELAPIELRGDGCSWASRSNNLAPGSESSRILRSAGTPSTLLTCPGMSTIASSTYCSAGEIASRLQAELRDHFGLEPDPVRESAFAARAITWFRERWAKFST